MEERREMYRKLSNDAALWERAGEYARAYNGWLKPALPLKIQTNTTGAAHAQNTATKWQKNNTRRTTCRNM